MQNKLDQIRGRDSEKAVRVKRTAILAGVSTRTVYRVIHCEEETDPETIEKVMKIYMSLQEGEDDLIKAVKKAVPL